MKTEMRQVEEFIEEYKRSRVVVETTLRAILNRALEFEQKFQKPFYEFTIDEVIEMYTAAHAISIRSLQNANLILKHASRWMLDKQGKDIKNTYDDVTKELVEECIDTKKKAGLILTKDDLIEIQAQLLNYTDKAILLMLFLGAGAKWLKELTFFDISQANKNECVIYFRTGKTIPITYNEYELIKNACEETELVSFGGTSRISVVQSDGFYKVRANALSANEDMRDEESVARRYRFIQRRLMLISKDLGVTLTSSGIQESGLLYHIKECMESSGLSFLEFVRTEWAGVLARRYDLYTELYPQILREKFLKYFQ